MEAPDLPPIGDYALIGDGRTAALSSAQGSIDWLCLPRFDSDPIFGRLVGGDRAGRFSLDVDGRTHVTRRYRESSTVLETRWRTRRAEVRLTEGMVLKVTGHLLPQVVLVRRLESEGAPALVRVVYDPRSGLNGDRLRNERRSRALVSLRGTTAIALRSTPELPVVPGEALAFDVQPGRPVTFVMSMSDRQPLVFVEPDHAFGLLDETDKWWRHWTSRITYRGPVLDQVVRSLITLRLLTYAPSGAPVAAPTTSLPERIGGGRNWDYRFAWPRDASIGVTAFLTNGLDDEAESFLHWLLQASRLTRPRLHVVYSVDGKPQRGEHEVPAAPGYRGSRPVRIGNSAGRQHQLDVYGWVVDTAWNRLQHGGKPNPAIWSAVRSTADWIAKNWRQPDAGIWEVRERPAHYVHSKLMAWLALDRVSRIARSRRTRPSRLERWVAERDALAADIRARGFDERRGAYVRSYGADELDAAVLILPTLEFDPPESPRVKGTIDAIRRELSAGGPLLYRYPPGSDGVEGGEGAFLPCSFWLVQALARTGRVDDAVSLFDELCKRSNVVGLFGEEMDPSTGEHLGNFPQALTHAALIQAALALQAATAD
ncbi:MAG TPA: glycoside hydrolase family 15 protein [Actinomycetota bacterium]|nr:glycoside hydrolase family 15 protein [Actinomycetota bacterium]